MSSFIAHGIVGAVLANQQEKKSFVEFAVVTLFFIMLSFSPDIDYLLHYLRGEAFSIRYTHSIAYALSISLIALIIREYLFKAYLKTIPVYLFIVAPLSHLILDLLVGVHPNPYFYPFSSETFVFPWGILPSAGHIDLDNYYFWRNTLIELSIFIPLALFTLAGSRIFLSKHKYFIVLLILCLALGIYVGINLER